MATKSKQTPAINGQAAAGNGKAARIDVLELDDEIEDRLQSIVNGWGSKYASAYSQQKRVCEELKAKLEHELQFLELLAEPLRTAERAFDKALLEKLAAARPHDAAIKTSLGKTRLKVNGKYDFKTRKYKQKETGAQPWKQLAADGATDAQVWRNVTSVEREHATGEAFVEQYGGGPTLKLRTAVGPDVEIAKGKEKIIAEVRRVFGIPVIAAPAKGAKGKGAKGKSGGQAAVAGGAKGSTTKQAPAAKKSPPKKKSSKPPGVNRDPKSAQGSAAQKTRTAEAGPGRETVEETLARWDRQAGPLSDRQAELRATVNSTLSVTAASLLNALLDGPRGACDRYAIEKSAGYAVSLPGEMDKAWGEMDKAEHVKLYGNRTVEAASKFYDDPSPATPAALAGPPGNVAAHAAEAVGSRQ